MSSSLLTSHHPAINLPFTQRDNVPLNNPNDMFNERLPYASLQGLEYEQGICPVGVLEQRGPQLGQERQIHVNGSGSDQVRERSERNPTDILKSRPLAYHGSEQLPPTHR